MTIIDLVTRGYFPEELPIPFTSQDLSRVINIIVNHPTIYPIQAGTNGKPKTCKTISFSIPKIRAYRRTLGIPHPLLYIKFSEYISNNWTDIVASARSSLSLSPLKIEANSHRSLVQPSFDIITKERILRSIGFRFVLKVDIQKFYGNIYTHTIPWVLHTKPVAKARRNDNSLLGNKLDWFIRNMQDSQTIGIPIGPDTSRIISELIAAYIDKELEKELGVESLHGIRVVDDYSLYFKDMATLERARASILKLLRDLELDLNQAKEKVLPLPEIIESEWYNNLRLFRFTNKKEKQIKEIIAYFDMSFKYSEMFPEETILPYSISKIAATVVQGESWPILEALLLKSLQVEPKVLPFVIRLFLTHKDEGFDLSMDSISKTLIGFLEDHLDLGNHFEISWILWFMKVLEIQVPKSAAIELSKSDNPIVILTALDLGHSNLIPDGLDTTEWKKLMTADNLYTENWLVAYEALVKDWLPSKTNYVNADPFFKLLKDNDVSFYLSAEEFDLSEMKLTRETEYAPKHRDNDDEEEDKTESNILKFNFKKRIFTDDDKEVLKEILGEHYEEFIRKESIQYNSDDDLPF